MRVKTILIIHYSMEIGGAESSLLGMLQNFDYSRVDVSLLLLRREGELMKLIPSEVHLLDTPKAYHELAIPIKDVVLEGGFGIAAARLFGKIFGRFYSDRTYNTKQYSHKFALPFLPRLSGEYDLAISYIDPHYIAAKKVDALARLAWLHTDFSRIGINKKQDEKMWELFDRIIHVSDNCKKAFDEKYPTLSQKSIVIENILSKELILHQGKSEAVLLSPDSTNLLSVGRFCEQKNFDNVPFICRRLIDSGLNVKWYLIGYGGDEALIRQRIAEAGMKNRVIILGKKENPYPYIASCDLYVQPSRYEGKAVTVREAQMLGKPVVITRYATSPSQLEDGVDGVIVPIDNDGCADGIAELLRDPAKMEMLAANCRMRDYSNADEIEKIYEIMKG